MKVLFIGYPKCGTKTMSVVFKTLGYKVYDFPENFQYLNKEWTKILKEGATAEDFKKMYADVDACVDTPVYPFWEEILEAFPETKLLVMYREEEAWLKSFMNQSDAIQKNKVMQLINILSPSAQRATKLCRLFVYHILGGDRNAWPWEFSTGINYTLMRHRYRQHNLYIQERAPKDQLHVVDFKQGWEPICKFLDVPVPDEPFPHANKAGELVDQLMKEHPIFLKWQREALISVCLLVVLLAMGIYYVLV